MAFRAGALHVPGPAPGSDGHVLVLLMPVLVVVIAAARVHGFPCERMSATS